MALYFAAIVGQSGDVWIGREVDLDTVEDLDALADLMRDTIEDGPALFFLEEDDEYVAIVRVDGDGDARTFISDERAVNTSAHAAMVMEDITVTEPEEDEEEGIRPEAVPFGDADLVASFGVPADSLLALCAEEGRLPADVITAICEKAGCADVLDDLRG